MIRQWWPQSETNVSWIISDFLFSTWSQWWVRYDLESTKITLEHNLCTAGHCSHKLPPADNVIILLLQSNQQWLLPLCTIRCCSMFKLKRKKGKYFKLLCNQKLICIWKRCMLRDYSPGVRSLCCKHNLYCCWYWQFRLGTKTCWIYSSSWKTFVNSYFRRSWSIIEFYTSIHIHCSSLSWLSRIAEFYHFMDHEYLVTCEQIFKSKVINENQIFKLRK